jgi:hypothetical protein
MTARYRVNYLFNKLASNGAHAGKKAVLFREFRLPGSPGSHILRMATNKIKKDKTMQRPTSVTVFGILNIVFAAFGFFGVIASAMLFTLSGANSSNPVIQLIQDNPSYAAWIKISVVLGILVSIGLLASGIGLLKLKPWARIFSIVYAIYSIVMIIVGTVVNYFFLVQPLLEKAHNEQGPAAAGAIGGAIGGMFGGCLGIIYPILLLIFMMRPKVIAAFNPSLPADGMQPPQ